MPRQFTSCPPKRGMGLDRALSVGRYALYERIEVWGAAGYGLDTLGLEPEDAEANTRERGRPMPILPGRRLLP